MARSEGLVSFREVIDGSRRWTVILGDCLSVMSEMPDACIDHVCTDPPYESQAHTLQRRVKREGGVAVVEPLSFPPITDNERSLLGRELGRVSKRWTIAFCQVEAAMRWSASFEAGGLNVRRIGVWIKPDGQPQLSGDRPGMGYETLVFAHAPGRSVWNGGGRVAVFTANKNDPIDFGKNSHPTQKPTSLMLELIALFTDPGDVILDPFAGSGTTGVAALRLGRRCVLIEKDPKFAALCRDRLRSEESGSTLDALRNGQAPLFPGEAS